MSSVTLRRYTEWAERVRAFARTRRLSLASPQQADVVLERYCEYLRLQGEAPSSGRYALASLAFDQGWSTAGGAAFPLTKRALKGWLRDQPELSRDPMTWVAALLYMEWLCEACPGMGRLAARGLHPQFDAFLRPAELLALNRSTVLPPVGRNGSASPSAY